MNRSIYLSDIQREVWAMDDRHLSALAYQIAESGLETPAAGAALSRTARKGGSTVRTSNGISIIPITGVLMKAVPWYYDALGIETTTYSQIASDIQSALADPNVQGIILKIESPGGQVAGVDEAAQSIFQARKTKPIHCFIEDLGASGAYWLASQTLGITANSNAMVGSIGVYTVFIDDSKWAAGQGVRVHVIRSGEHKGMGVPGAEITESQIAAMQDVIDSMGSHFVDAVAAGRGRSKDVIKGLATGQIWLAPAAKANGLIDQVGLFSILGVLSMNVLSSGHEDFVTLAQCRAKEQGIAYNEAASQLCSERPELYAEYKRSCQEGQDRGRQGSGGSHAETPQGNDDQRNREFTRLAEARSQQQGISFTEAGKLIAKERPDLYSRG